MQAAEWGLDPTHLIVDHDTKYTKEFDAVLESQDVEIVRVGPRAPNLKEYVSCCTLLSRFGRKCRISRRELTSTCAVFVEDRG